MADFPRDWRDLREWALRFVRWNKGSEIEELLQRAGGDVGRGLELCREKADPWDRETIGLTRLARWADSGTDSPRIEVYESAPDGVIRVWGSETDDRRRPPDLVLRWREVYECVARLRQPVLPGMEVGR